MKGSSKNLWNVAGQIIFNELINYIWEKIARPKKSHWFSKSLISYYKQNLTLKHGHVPNWQENINEKKKAAKRKKKTKKFSVDF